jgi:protein TonB
VIQFVVDKDGNLSNMKALTHHGYGMEQEVLRVLLKSPKWLPAIQDGRQVKAYRKQPVTFQITEEGPRKKSKKKNKD